ncbi:uncharacterized protein DSM5745_11034 [Aspergillus mulundensis]|uniref:Uncharacterized protein n=1 Tax=Aspergillus mulundensis TaxID=1810919 RepID=A0A3D8QC38_9EURO|nr:hypothetical protein DSM5745_11034 [Aspergillus mulundensis]RDW59339.1 hypothetical protein DSM5745_11034 [Aspergillus mulundensis]
MIKPCCPGFKEVYDKTRIEEIESEMSLVMPRRLFARPSGSNPAMLRYESELERVKADEEIEKHDNKIHQILRGLDKNGVHYMYKTAVKPRENEKCDDKQVNEKHPYRLITILVDIPSRIEVNGKLMREIVADLPDISNYASSGAWCWELPGDNDNPSLWRLDWFQRELLHHNWGFTLVAYNLGNVDLNEDGQFRGGTGNPEGKRAYLDLHFDVSFPENYDVNFIPPGSFYGP